MKRKQEDSEHVDHNAANSKRHKELLTPTCGNFNKSVVNLSSKSNNMILMDTSLVSRVYAIESSKPKISVIGNLHLACHTTDQDVLDDPVDQKARINRSGIVKFLADTKIDEKETGKADLAKTIKDLMFTLRNSVKQTPRTFSPSSQPNSTSIQELKEFSTWWCVGLSSYLFNPVCKQSHSEIRAFISDVITVITNKSILAYITDNLLHILAQIIVPPNNRHFSVTMAYNITLPQNAPAPPPRTYCLNYRVPINDSNENGSVFIFGILSMLISKSQPQQVQLYYDLLYRAWNRFQFPGKYCLLNYFDIPNDIFYEGESSIYRFVCKVLTDSLQETLNDNEFYLLEKFCKRFIQSIPFLLVDIKSKIFCSLSISAFFQRKGSNNFLDRKQSLLFKVLKSLTSNYCISKELSVIKNWGVRNYCNQFKLYHPYMVDVISVDTVNYIEYSIFQLFDDQVDLNSTDEELCLNASVLELNHAGENVKVATQRFSTFLDELYSNRLSSTPKLTLNADLLYTVIKRTLPFIKMCGESRDLVQEFVNLEKTWVLKAELVPVTFLDNWIRTAVWAVSLSPFLIEKTKMTTLIEMVIKTLPTFCAFYGDQYRLQDDVDDSMRHSLKTIVCLTSMNFLDPNDCDRYSNQFPLKGFIHFYNEWYRNIAGTNFPRVVMQNFFEVITTPIVRDMEGDFVISLIEKIMTDFNDWTFLTLIKLIGEFWWPIRSLPFVKILNFVTQVVWTKWWTFNELEERAAAVAKAIVRLPCIYSNRRRLIKGEGNISHLHTLKGCRACHFDDDGEKFTGGKILSTIAKLAKFLITNEGGAQGSIDILDLLVTVNNHSSVPVNFLPKLLPLVNISDEKILFKLFKVVATLGQDKETVNYKAPSILRADIVRTFADTLRRHVLQQDSPEEQFSASARIAQHIHEVVEYSDDPLMLEFIKLSLHFTAMCMTEDIAEAFAKMSMLFAKKNQCSSVEIVCKHREAIAKTLLESIADHLYSDVKSEWVVGTTKVSQYMTYLETVLSVTRPTFLKYCVPAMLNLVVPGIQQCPKKQFLILALSEYSKESVSKCLKKKFVTFYPFMVFNGDFDLCANYMKIEYVFDCDATALDQFRDIITELMCHMYKSKDKLAIAISHVLCWEKNTKRNYKTPSIQDIQGVISRNIWNIFTHFSAKLSSKYISQDNKRKIILAFAEVIHLMGTAVVSQHKTKIYAALIALFSLGPKYFDVQVSLWKQYMLNLDEKSLSDMCTEVTSAILAFQPTHPDETADLIKYLTSKRAEILIDCGRYLHFLPQYCQQSVPMTRIKNSAENIKREGWLNYFDVTFYGCRNKNMFVRYQSVKALRDLIKQEEDTFIERVLLHYYPNIFPLVLALLSASRDDDVRVKALAAECLGIIGALNPNLFSKNPMVMRHSWKGPREFTIRTSTFITKYLEELVSIFKESEDNWNFDVAACCIINIVQEYKLSDSQNSKFWKNLEPDVKNHIQPLLDCKYAIQDKNYVEPNVTYPIYSSNNIPNYEEWIKTWSLVMINYIKDESALPIFKANRQLILVSSRLANFIINYIAFYVVMGDESSARKYILDEMKYIIQLWKSAELVEYSMTQSVPSAPGELVDLVPLLNKSEDYFVTKPKIHKKSGLQTRHYTKAAKESEEEEVMKYKCTKTVFSIVDHLHKAHRHLCKQYALPANHPSLINQPIPFSHAKVGVLGRILNEISFKQLADAAFHSKSYTKALIYLEQHVKQHPIELSNSLELLQRIFISLNDMDSAMAVASLRTGKTSFDESILETMINGKSEDVVSCFESATAHNTNDVLAYEGLIQSYISLDEPNKASILIQHCIRKNSSWTNILSEAQYASLLKLGDWNSISKNVLDTNRDIRALESISERKTEETYHLSKWNSQIATALLQIKKCSYSSAQNIIDNLRIRLLEPFSNVATNGESSYKAHYTNIIGLHILAEIQQVSEFLKGNPNMTSSRMDSIRTMLQRWNKRINTVENSEHIFRPILDVRKVLLSIMMDHFSTDPDSVDFLNASVRDCWLIAARQERKHGKLFRSANSVTNALTSQSSIECTEILIESAKLQIQKGAKSKALSLLQTALKPLEEVPKSKFARTSSSSYLHMDDKDYEKKLKSKVLLLYAKLCDEMRVADQETNVSNFSKAIKAMKESEKNYFNLACYLDRLLNSDSEERKFKNTNIQCLIAKNYAESLKYGTKYVYQSLPRLLSIWFDFGTNTCGCTLTDTCITCSQDKRNDLPKFLDAFADFSSSQSLLYMTRIVDSLVECLPMHIFMTAFSQLISRLCHSNTEIWNQLSKIIVSIICAHPTQSLWMTMSVAKSSYKMRSMRIKEIFKKVEQKPNKLGPPKRIIVDYTSLSEKLIQLANTQVDKRLSKIDIGSYVPALQKLLTSKNFNNVLVPIEQFLFPKLRAGPSQHNKYYNAFHHTAVYIQSIEPTVYLMSSLQRPKKIVFRGSDGHQYPFMCKPKDDLRKDCKVMEVNNVINHYLKQSNQGLRVRTYAVVPLNEECGLLEWVNNLMGLRPIVNNLYREKNKGLPSRTLLEKQCSPTDNIEKKRKVYSDVFLPAHPPVLSEWFLYNFPNHRSWYQARQNFMKTAAVMSIVGYIFGLGDRHGENIMVDTITGDIVHVDFNCLFLEGENLRYPERVPFRLTQNMVDAMGICGANGVFRKSCELTLTTIREQKSKIISVLRPFVFDPLVEWGEVSTSSSSSSAGELQNSKATENLIYIKHRINGTARSQTKITDTELSVEAHVAYLMDAATSIDNLCQMYIGWAAFI